MNGNGNRAHASPALTACFYCHGTGKFCEAECGFCEAECGFCDAGRPLDTQEDWDRSWGHILSRSTRDEDAA